MEGRESANLPALVTDDSGQVVFGRIPENGDVAMTTMLRLTGGERPVHADKISLPSLKTKSIVAVTRVSFLMTIPDYQSLMLLLLVMLGDNQEHMIRGIRDQLTGRFGLTQEERSRQSLKCTF